MDSKTSTTANSTNQNKAPASEHSVVDQVLIQLGSAPRPWFLKVSDVYTFVKTKFTTNAVCEKTATTIDQLVLAINTKVIHLTNEENFSFTGGIDGLLSSLTTKADAAMDSVRGSLFNSILKLKAAVMNQAAVKQVMACDAVKTVTSKVDGVLTYIFQNAFHIAETRGTVVLLPHIILRCITYNDLLLLSLAIAVRPTVQKVVGVAQPYVMAAVEASQPLINVASPYVEKTKQALEGNQYVGSYVKTGLDKTGHIIHEVKTYCSTEADETDPATESANLSEDEIRRI